MSFPDIIYPDFTDDEYPDEWDYTLDELQEMEEEGYAKLDDMASVEYWEQ